jgi:protein involved in polysaccharide export with SLBB domain
MTRSWRLLTTWLFAAILIAWALPHGVSAAPAAAPAPAASFDDGYKLGSGDKLRVMVFGESDLGGEYVLDGTGFISLPLIGQIHAAGDTIHQFESEITTKLKDGYLKDPRVSVEVINYRPFYIIGEINKPGEFPYVYGMSILNAVALAGGYTFRANEKQVYVRRGGAGGEQSVNADQTTKIFPGDIIRVAERFF